MKRDANWVKYERRLGIAWGALFAAFLVLSMVIGGDAINGEIRDGVYYVTAGGREVPVKPHIWHLSATLGWVVILTFIPLFGYVGIAKFTKHS